MTTINITQALCLTLVHSLWQGFLAAVAAGIIILSTRKSKAAVRYNLLTADLILFLLASVCTFLYELDGASGSGGGVSSWVAGKVSGLEETAVLDGIQLQVHGGIERSSGIIGEVSAFLTLHASTVVSIWMLCLLGQLVQLMGGLYQVGRLRRRRVFDPGSLWQERLQVLAARLGIRKTVALIQSAYVSMPVTFGFLKPSVLVPLGMLTNLPADQVETVLLHELAHIRRNDYLANLLLHITEAVFFFNPGLRWIASLIREEREACCDDMVLNTADRNSYFDALVAFGENAFVRQRYALPLGKEKTDLLWRIRRMLNQENKKLHIMEKAILSFGLTAILAIGLVSMRSAEQQAEKRQSARVPVWKGTDTLPTATNASSKGASAQFPSISTRVEDNGSQKKYKIDATDVEGNTFQLTKINGTVTELVINGRSIPEKDFDQYLYIFDEIESRNHETAGEQEGEDKVSAAERELAKAQERLDAANQDQVDAQERLEEQQERQQELLEQQQEKQQEKLEQDQERQQEAAEQKQEAAEQAAERKQEAAEQEAERKQEAAEKEAEQRQDALDKQQEAVERQQEAAQQLADQRQEAYEKQQEVREQQEENRNAASQAINQIIGDMIDLGLVGSREDIHSFTLDNNGLILNGTRQSGDAYQSLRRRYIRNAAEHYIYAHNGSGTTVDVKQDHN